MRKVLLSCCFTLLASTIYAGDITIPMLELITRGALTNGKPEFSTQGSMDLEISGGIKMGGRVSLGFTGTDLSFIGQPPPSVSDYEFDDSDLVDFAKEMEIYQQDMEEYLKNKTSLDFLGAEISIRNLFNNTTELSYFLGENDIFAAGNIFPSFFGTGLVNTQFKGPLYFEDTTYNGIHQVKGTGLKLFTTFGSAFNASSFYLYQDGHGNKLGKYDTVFSTDLNSAFHFNNVNLEFFLGATFPKGAYGLYRGGLLFHYAPEAAGEFFAQIGITKWDPDEDFGIDLFYFLIEPRIIIDPAAFILTFFWHPRYYLQAENPKFADEGYGYGDINANFRIGNPGKHRFQGGLQAKFGFNTSNVLDDLDLRIIPYLNAVTAGVIWTCMLNIDVLESFPEEMFSATIGIQAQF